MDDINQARESNAEATVTLEQAKEEHAEAMNLYVKAGFETLAENCNKVKTPFSTGNIFFGKKKDQLPRDDIFQTATGQKLKRKPLAEYVQEIVINATGEQENDWKSSSKSNGVIVEWSPSRTIEGATFYRAKATLDVTPRELLLTQIRSSVVGSADDHVSYMREHYSFVDGKTFLFHNVRKALPNILGMDLFQLRDFFDFAHWEEHDDGTIIFSSQSVDLPAKIKGCQRGDNLVFGIMMKPIRENPDDLEEGDEPAIIKTEATLVTQFRANGFAPGKLVDAFAPRGIGQYLKNVEKEAIALRGSGRAAMLIKKYVELDLE